MTLLDSMLARYAPNYVARRVLARQSHSEGAQALAGHGNSPVDAAGRGGSRWWNPMARDARSDTQPTLGFDRAKSRELCMTSPFAVGAINTNHDRVVGTGLALVPEPNAAVLGWTPGQVRDFKNTVQREFSLWADSNECDYTGDGNFYDGQGLVLVSTLMSGDCFTVLPDDEPTAAMPYALRFQILEADQVGNEGGKMDTVHEAGGIRFNEKGRRTHAHIYNRHPGGAFLGGSLAQRYAGTWYEFTGKSGRRRVLQHFRKRRSGQARGTPYLAPIVECIKQMGRYSDAEVTAAVVSAMFTVFIETETGTPPPVFDGPATDANGPEISMGYGAVVGLAKGEKANFANPNRPNPNFEKFVAGVATQIGMALGFSRSILLKDFSDSYSASRAALLDAWIYFRGVRAWLARSFCQPVYETWFAEAVMRGRIKAPGFFTDPLLRWAYTRAAWHGDSMGSINPKDEVAAYTAAIDARLMTRERAEWELFGSDFDGTYDRKLDENNRLKADGILPVPKAGAAAPDNSAGNSKEGGAA